MSYKVSELVEFLQNNFDQDEVLAVPFIWRREDVQSFCSVEVGHEAWERIVRIYCDDENFCEWSVTHMTEVVEDVINGFQ